MGSVTDDSAGLVSPLKPRDAGRGATTWCSAWLAAAVSASLLTVGAAGDVVGSGAFAREARRLSSVNYNTATSGQSMRLPCDL